MIKILITAHDTEVGKTRATAALARALTDLGKTVEIVKAVQSGVPEGELGDADWALSQIENAELASAQTLFSYKAPLAPIQSAEAEGAELNFALVLNALKALPDNSDIQLIEGAGGIAVPLEHSGKDYADLAHELEVNFVVIVIQNRMGSMNQTRLTYSYAPKSIPAGIIFNDVFEDKDPAVTASNYETLTQLNIPIWGHIKHNTVDISNLAPFYEPVAFE
ncbi:MAG: dethiobiotin synthase [Coraliomargarita sp.]|nr:dethiobiotin synthase [Coraliomargarita sp.]